MKNFNGKGFKNIYNKLFLPLHCLIYVFFHWCWLSRAVIQVGIFLQWTVLEMIFSFPWGQLPLLREWDWTGVGWVLLCVSVSARQVLWSLHFFLEPPIWQGQVCEGPGAGRKGWFISGVRAGLVLIFPSPLESTKMLVPCPGFWPLASHRIFHRVDSLAQVVWKGLNIVTKAFWGVLKKWHLCIHCSAIRGEFIGHHIF